MKKALLVTLALYSIIALVTLINWNILYSTLKITQNDYTLHPIKF
jgi:hypothetical protein